MVLCFTVIYLIQMDSLTGFSQYQDVIYAIVFNSTTVHDHFKSFFVRKFFF